MFFKFFRKKSFLKGKLNLINEQKSPLFRIMAVYDDQDPIRRRFSNNICAFHIGNGLILSVAHNLRTSNMPPSISDNEYRNLTQSLDVNQKLVFDACYPLDTRTQKRYLNSINLGNIQQVSQILNQIGYDLRYVTQYEKTICKPFLVIQFRDGQFYKDATITERIHIDHSFVEPKLSRHTFLIELKLVKAFYNEDIAVYKIVNTDQEVINKIPFLEIDFSIYDRSKKDYYCLQSAPVDNLGRLLNDASVDGLLDHWNNFPDRIGGNYIMEGLRYLIKGYFRFGSSGAPYLIYDFTSKKFKVNAIQSEASPIQLSIKNNRDGNFQYVNAIATPMKIIEKELKQLLEQDSNVTC